METTAQTEVKKKCGRPPKKAAPPLEEKTIKSEIKKELVGEFPVIKNLQETLFSNRPANISRKNAIKNNQIKIIGNKKALEYIDYIVIVLNSGEIIKECFLDFPDYDFVKDFLWGWDASNGYVKTDRIINNNKKEKLYLHRLILEKNGIDLSNREVDHINGNRLDCRKINLRPCEIQENRQNVSKRKIATSQYKGVYYDKTREKWVCCISNKNIGQYRRRCNSEIEAAKKYNELARDFFGEFAKLNDIKE
jgi:hypothetical protein